MFRQYKQVAYLSETLYGDVFLCEVPSTTTNDNDDTTTTSAPSVNPHQPEYVVVKRVDLRRAMAMLNTATTSSDADCSDCGLDDPREEKAVSNLLRRTHGHPNLVRYYDNAIVDGVLYLVMEFCAGGDLHTYVINRPQHPTANSAAPTPLEALTMTHQIASGLRFLHHHDIAHRDISLENVLLQDGICKLVDFGLATKATRRCTDRVGKAYYMAPEVVAAGRIGDGDASSTGRRSAYDPKAADMWSLGIVLFMLLTGSPLISLASVETPSFCSFQRAGLFAVLNAWGMGEQIPKEVQDLLFGLLQIDPRSRLTVDQVLAHDAFQLLHPPSASHHQEEGSTPPRLDRLHHHHRIANTTRQSVSVDIGRSVVNSLIET